MSRDPRVDAYIAKAQPFAQPILSHVRERVHAAVPGVEEAIKWSAPGFTLDGKILLMMAAFKQHVAVAPGVGFGEEGEGFVRIALVENEQRLRQAARGVKKMLSA